MKSKLLKASAGFLAILAACGVPADSRVGVRPVTADLVFGIPPVEEPVGPPGADFEAPIAGLGDFRKPIRSGPIILKPLCDEADSKQVRFSASNYFERMPPVGEFRWKMSGFASDVLTGVRVPLPDFEKRTIEKLNVKTQNTRTERPDDFTYVTVQQEVGSLAVVTTTWHVIRDQVVDNQPPAPDVESPLNGLYIQSIVKDKAGTQATFNPQPEVLVLPYGTAADIPDRFGNQQAYVDPQTQESWQLQGTVREQRIVDACGEMIDTRWVDGWLKVVSSAGTFETNYDYGIATQYGAILVAEHIEQCPDNFHYQHAQGEDGEEPPKNANEACQRVAGTTTEKRPIAVVIDRNIGVVPPEA